MPLEVTAAGPRGGARLTGSRKEGRRMAFVVTENCVKCKYMDCVCVCPTDAFHEGENFLVISPDSCIDCGGCAPVCPSGAIFADREVPPQWAEYVGLNARLAERWPIIREKKEPPADADAWNGVTPKRHHLSEAPG